VRTVVQPNFGSRAGGGDRGGDAELVGERLGQFVGTPMTAQEGHDGAAVIGEGDDRRLGPLVVQQGRDGADQDAGG
jgi:hypothetical protein